MIGRLIPEVDSYNKTNQMHYFLKFIFGMKLYRFPTVPLSIIRSFFFFFFTHSDGICHTACEEDKEGSAVPS